MTTETLPISRLLGSTGSPSDTLPHKGLGGFIRSFLIACEQEEKSKRTRELYEKVLVRYYHFVDGGKETADLIRQFLISLRKTMNASSEHIYYRNLKAFYNWLVREELITKSPMQNVKPPKLPKILIRPFSEQDIKNLLKVTSGKRFVDYRNRAIVLLLIDTALRLEEVTNIRLLVEPEELDLNAQTIHVRGKGSKDRVVHFGLRTKAALKLYLQLREDRIPYLWLSELRTPLTRAGMKINLVRLCKLAEIKDAKCAPHTFRHTAAHLMHRRGMPVTMIQKILGHSNIATTARYLSCLGTEDVIDAHLKASPVDMLFK